LTTELNILLITAASIGFFHTLFGPDHYLPFIVMSKSGEWSKNKTFWVTLLCGIGHVGSSVIIGLIGIAFGIAVSKLVFIESFRGDIAAWLFTAFGLAYFIWGMKRAYKNKPHTHFHSHGDGVIHSHTHVHKEEHTHVHEDQNKPSLTPWVLFTIFVFGPCEPLIPLLMYPAAQRSSYGIAAVALTFGIVTISTMLSVVFISIQGIDLLPMKKLERYTHALAGAAICVSGLLIIVLGL
jgi:nickel/cobalt transporter (NicO) family protein